jgi:hypothetical protein
VDRTDYVRATGTLGLDGERTQPPDGRASGPLAGVGSETVAGDRAGVRLVAFVTCALLVALPFLVVTLAPVTDLPQHLAQIRLLHEALADPDGPYRVQWFTPYLLGYLPLGVAWYASPGVAAGRIAMLMLAGLWIVAVHWLAFRRARGAAGAILASTLFYNHVTYWGYYSFILGWPVFLLWFLLTARSDHLPFRWSDGLRYLGAAGLLYLSHALWLAAGVAWLLLRSLADRTPVRTVALQLASISPVLVVAALWYRQLSGFSSPTRWITTPSARLSLSWIVDSTLGGLQGTVESTLFCALASWVAVGIYQHRDRLAAHVDRDLCLAAGFFFALALVLPQLHQNTVAFASRWQPLAAIALLLGVPAPTWDRRFRNAAALVVLAVFILVTSLAWVRFEKEEWAGLPETLAALPANPRVIGLDYVKSSPIIRGRPFLQGFAYAQVVRGGRLNFSFAEFGPMAVVYKTPPARLWTHGLEWFPERVTPSDFSHFDYAIVHADGWQHASLTVSRNLTPVTGKGRWRLYRIDAIAR